MIVYQDEWVTLYHADCLEQLAWLEADVLITDPPYGMSYVSNMGAGHKAIAGDESVDLRDDVVELWGGKPAAIFGTWRQPPPHRNGKPVDLG